jgi:hypothetical protein
MKGCDTSSMYVKVCGMSLHQFFSTFPSEHFMSVQMVKEKMGLYQLFTSMMHFFTDMHTELEIISTITNDNQITLVATTTMLPI